MPRTPQYELKQKFSFLWLKSGSKMYNFESIFQRFFPGEMPPNPPNMTRGCARLNSPPPTKIPGYTPGTFHHLTYISTHLFTISRPLNKALGHLKMHHLTPIFEKKIHGGLRGGALVLRYATVFATILLNTLRLPISY